MNLRLNSPARLAAALVVLGVAGLAPPALAQYQPPGGGNDAPGGGMVRIDMTGGAATQNVSIPQGQSATVELPVDARDVLVTNPLAADVVLRSPRHISVLGLKTGMTDAVFFDAANRRILTLIIRVHADGAASSALMNRLMPGANIHADVVGDSIVLSGQVANLADADRAVQFARSQVQKPEQVINMLSIAGKDQVMVKVRIVEVQRNIVKQLGVNFQALAQAGATAFSFAATPTYAINGQLLGGGAAGLETTGNHGLNQLAASLQAFERVGLVRTLAEPNLTAVSGEAAKFLVGGEFPVPVGRDITGQVTIEFKPYGIGLGFTPIVLSGGRISLKISTEVSELDNSDSFTLGFGGGAGGTTTTTSCTVGTSGCSSNGTITTTTTPTTSGTNLVVPSLIVRRAETTVEMPSGGAMMIAGLLQDTSKQNIDGLPGLKNLPILGALFRSRDYQAGQTELVIIVTPYIVGSTRPEDLQTPADGLKVANDTDTILLGRLNKAYNRPPEATAGRSYQGPVGYVIE